MWKGTQFMTEKSGGSDVGALESEARQENGDWRLYGDKWFCSHTDADLALAPGASRRARPPALAAWDCSRCRGGSKTAAATLPNRAPEGQARHALDGERRDSRSKARSHSRSASCAPASSR